MAKKIQTEETQKCLCEGVQRKDGETGEGRDGDWWRKDF